MAVIFYCNARDRVQVISDVKHRGCFVAVVVVLCCFVLTAGLLWPS